MEWESGRELWRGEWMRGEGEVKWRGREVWGKRGHE
jgi:hypothetical protein